MHLPIVSDLVAITLNVATSVVAVLGDVVHVFIK